MDEFELFSLTLVWPKSGVPGVYTLDEVKVGHYLLWDYISKSPTPYDKPEAVLNLLCNGCYACEYTLEPPRLIITICDSCPVNWGSNTPHCADFGTAWYEWMEMQLLLRDPAVNVTKYKERARKLAEQIRDVSWKDGVGPLEVKTDGMRFVTVEQFEILLKQYEEESNNG